MNSRLQRLIKEPLVHFTLVGALLFAIEGGWGRGALEERRLILGAELPATLATEFERTQKRAPSDTELKDAVNRWVDDEILYREGLMRGLDRDDARIRERVVSKMARILREGVLVPEPSEESLRIFFEAHREKFSRGSLVDFTHVFIEGTDDAALIRANELLGKLRAGGDPATLGDMFHGGRRFRRRKLTDLATTFGDDFVVGLDTQLEHTWERRRSTFGYHLVRLERRTPPEAGGFEASRLDVEKLWRDTQRDEGARRALEELKARWSVTMP